MGNTLKGLGRLDEAIASYTQAIALNPDLAEGHSNLGNMFKEVGRLDEALDALHEVQVRMLAANKWQSLVHSLENEASILELEGRGREAAAIRRRIADIETGSCCLG